MNFFLLKNEKDKSKDMSIVKSWYVNNTRNSNLPKHQLEDSINMAIERKMPFLSSRQIEKEETRRINAMILLGGFRKR